MNLSQKNYKKLLPKELIKQAEKSNVRECDETEKGYYQAYVDEKKSTFDVLIVINNQEIIEHSCDCSSTIAFCWHKVAVLLYLEKGSTNSGQKIKKNKKASPLEALLEEVDAERLKDWVKNLLAKNKDLELAFLHQFSEQQKEYTPADVKQRTLNAVKAVAGKRKKLELSEAKKIAELWTEVHDPVTVQYYANVADKKLFLNHHAIATSCNEVLLHVHAAGTRLNKYITDCLQKAIEPLHHLQDEYTWDIATGYFAEQLNSMQPGLREEYLSFLTLLHEASNNERKERLTHKLVSEYARCNLHQQYNIDAYTYSILRLVKNSNLFDKYFNLFKPAHYQNDYNNELILLLIEHDQLKLAEKYSIEQIKSNSREEYSISYMEHLKNIYTIQKDDKKLVEILKTLIPQTFDFTDFKTVYEQLEGDEKKSWRTKILKRAGHMASNNHNIRLFSFRLMDYEQNYKKMMDYVDSYTPYSIIVQYADEMALTNKKEFIRKLMNMSTSYWPNKRKESKTEDEIFLTLFNILQKHYSVSELQLIIQQFEKPGYYSRRNEFVEFMIEQLNAIKD